MAVKSGFGESAGAIVAAAAAESNEIVREVGCADGGRGAATRCGGLSDAGAGACAPQG